MGRIVVGRCPSCGEALKTKDHAAQDVMQFTCHCGWQGQLHLDADVVSRATVLREERVVLRRQRAKSRRIRKLRRMARLCGIGGIAALAVAIVVWLSTGRINSVAIIFMIIAGALAVSLSSLWFISSRESGRRT